MNLLDMIDEKNAELKTTEDWLKHIQASNCQNCPRSEFRESNQDQKITTHRGNPNADVWVIGKSPGINDGKDGVPFSHGSGDILKKMLAYIGLDWDKDCFLTNPVMCAQAEDASPTSKEIDSCYLEKLISIGQPKLFIAVGSTAFKALTGKSSTMGEIAGKNTYFNSKFINKAGNFIPVYVIYHTAYFYKPDADVLDIKRKCAVTLNAIKSHLTTDPVKSMSEVADVMEVTKGRVTQINNNILRSLIWPVRMKEIKDFMDREK